MSLDSGIRLSSCCSFLSFLLSVSKNFVRLLCHDVIAYKIKGSHFTSLWRFGSFWRPGRKCSCVSTIIREFSRGAPGKTVLNHLSPLLGQVSVALNSQDQACQQVSILQLWLCIILSVIRSNVLHSSNLGTTPGLLAASLQAVKSQEDESQMPACHLLEEDGWNYQ